MPERSARHSAQCAGLHVTSNHRLVLHRKSKFHRPATRCPGHHMRIYRSPFPYGSPSLSPSRLAWVRLCWSSALVLTPRNVWSAEHPLIKPPVFYGTPQLSRSAVPHHAQPSPRDSQLWNPTRRCLHRCRWCKCRE